MGGGILPVALKNNKVYFLFGKENELDDTPGWADFGGGHENGETHFDTALREGSEEINGFLGSAEQLRHRVKKNKIATIRFKEYSTYIFKMEYDDNLPTYYKNNYEFFSRYLPHVKHKKENGLLEKSKIKWFSYEELKKNKSEFRSFYQHIVDLIIKEEKQITTNMNRCIQSRKRKHTLVNKLNKTRRCKK
jgi:8-oxo-dGTP pyrophosphatase MutT (NUDIX family)